MLQELLTYDQTSERTAEIMTYEASQVLRGMIYLERFGPVGYARTIRTETGDLIHSLHLYCEQMGYDYEELKAEGLERFKERMQQIKEGRQ
jgi:transcription initiation factor IIE alpha subunit